MTRRTSRRAALLRVAIVAALGATTGCFSMWATTQVTGSQRVWDERVREQAVPLPGVEDWFTVTIVATPDAAAPTTTRLGVSCAVAQRAKDAVYHQAFRYGSRWKKATAVMFALEGAVAAAYLLAGDLDSPDLLYGGLFALDALGTGVLFFVPRKEIYRRDEKPITTAVRSDCPEGLELAIGGDSFPVDAAGRLDELGAEAIDRWRQTPGGRLVASLHGRSVELQVGLAAAIAFPVGTLTAVASAGGGE